MTDKLRAAAELALEALENGKRVRNAEGGTKYQPDLEEAAITALRAALMSGTDGAEQQSAKHGEPVRTEFNRVINHAIEQGTEAWVFLRCWQQGDWSGCAEFGFEPNMAAYTAPQPAKPAEQEPVAWMPIATAPKGRIVLVHYKNSLGNGRTMRARYYLPETLDSDTTESGWADEGWYEESEAYEYLMPLDHEPTHWMPLPAAPDTAPQPTKQPLTDEELRDALRNCPHDTVENLRVRWLYAKDFARAIERAHGINVPQARGETK